MVLVNCTLSQHARFVSLRSLVHTGSNRASKPSVLGAFMQGWHFLGCLMQLGTVAKSASSDDSVRDCAI